MKLAAIDVGTNAVRLKIASRGGDGRLQSLLSRRDCIRPGEGVFETGRLPEYVIERLIDTLAEYGSLCRSHGVRPRAVATSALRDAHNRAEVIERVRARTGVHLEVISGREEARLVCLGVLEGTAPDIRSLCIDLGGGSTEVVVARGEHPSQLFSVDCGAVRLASQVEVRDRVGPAALAELRRRAGMAAQALPAGLGDVTRGLAVGSSGSVRALVQFATVDTRNFARRAELTRALEELAELDARRRRSWFDARRAEIIVAAAALLEAIVERIGVDHLRVTKRGLRDGVLADLSRRAERMSAAGPALQARVA